MAKQWTAGAGRRALVTGATGMVGRALAAQLGGEVVATTRSAASGAAGKLKHVAEAVTWDGTSELPAAALRDVEVVFHLAGEPVVEGRWDDAKKERILRSRVDSTRSIVRAIASMDPAARPRVLVCASAVGFYGTRGDELLTETSAPGEGFLADVCREWESEAARARELGVRVVSVRIGIVLSTAGGALAKMLPIFRAGLGGRLGDGKQWMPWIHIDDLVGLLRFAAANDQLEGPIDASAPDIVNNSAFTRALGAALHRPALVPAPAFALRLALGEAASVVLASQRVAPARALEAGYRFAHPKLPEALADLLPAKAPAHASVAPS
jgi:uncharacterized protein (TIGR01777 family)